MCISRSVIGAKPLVCAFSVIYKCLLTWTKYEFVEFFSLSTSLWRLGLYYFPSLSPLLPPLNTPAPPLPPKETMVASWLDEMAISWPDIHNSSQAACFQFYLPWFCLCISFLALRDVLAPSTAVFSHLCLFALAAPQDAHSPIQSTWQTLSIPQDPAEILPVSICLSASFSHTVYLPHLSSHTWPFKWQHYSHCAIANAPHSPTVATLCSKDDVCHCVCCLSIWYIVDTQWKLVQVSKTMCSCVTRRDMLWFGWNICYLFIHYVQFGEYRKKETRKEEMKLTHNLTPPEIILIV